jgi:hypothetical protein
MPKSVYVILFVGLFFIVAGIAIAIVSELIWWPVFLAALGISIALTVDFRTVPYGLLALGICQIAFLILLFTETRFIERLFQLAG